MPNDLSDAFGDAVNFIINSGDEWFIYAELWEEILEAFEAP